MLEYQCPPSLAVFLDGAAAIVDSYTRARRSRGISIKKAIFSSRSNSRRKRERKKRKISGSKKRISRKCVLRGEAMRMEFIY